MNYCMSTVLYLGLVSLNADRSASAACLFGGEKVADSSTLLTALYLF